MFGESSPEERLKGVNGLPNYVTVNATTVPIFRTLHLSTTEKVSSNCMHHVYHDYNNNYH